MSANIFPPAQPVEKSNFPHNRVQQTIEGTTVNVGTVINVGGFDDWWKLAETNGVRPWEIIWANFETCVPAEVNWYLHEYVGCNHLSSNKLDYTFQHANPGKILLPFGDAVVKIMVQRNKKPVPEDTSSDFQRFSMLKNDIADGEAILSRFKFDAYQLVSIEAKNPHAFDFKKESKSLLPPSIKDMLKGDNKRDRKIAPPGLPGTKDLVEGIVKAMQPALKENQDVRRRRILLYDAFSGGLAEAMDASYQSPRAGWTEAQMMFHKRGRFFGGSLSALQLYQLSLAIIERNRRGNAKSIVGAAIKFDQMQYDRRRTGSYLHYLLAKEFSSQRDLFRNASQSGHD